MFFCQQNSNLSTKSKSLSPKPSLLVARDTWTAAALSPSCYPGVNAAVVLGVVMVVAFVVPAM